MRKNSRGYWLDKRDDAFDEYMSGVEIKDELAISKFFESPSTMLWACFLRGYDAAEHRLHLTAFGVGTLAFLAGFGICWLAFVR